MENMERGKIIKYVDRAYPIINDEMGLPNTIIINGVKYKLTCAIDRHDFICIIMSSLVKVHCFSTEDAQKISLLYCEEKYNIYKRAVLEL